MGEYVTTVVHRANYTAVIHKPILSDEERKRREDEVKKALVKFYIERMKEHDYKNQNNHS